MTDGTRRGRLGRLLGARVAAPLAALGVALAFAGGAVVAQTGPAAAPEGKAAIEAIVRDYILAHPEIIPEAMERLQARQTAQALGASRQALETPFPGAVAGNLQGDTTLVVFFDFACPYCKQGARDIARLMAEDKQLRVVFRDFPVLSPASEEAALAALWAAQQGRYVEFHDAMFAGTGRLSRERTLASARKAGLDEAKLAKALDGGGLKGEIQKNLSIGRTLGLTGTPSYIVGDQLLSGAVGYEALKGAVAKARAANAA